MNRRTIFTPQRYVPYRNATNEWTTFLCEHTDPPGLIVKKINNTVGKGVFAGRKFPVGSFLMEYHGELITEEEGIKREQSYPVEFGSFLLYFKSGRRIMCLDATFSTQCGRYVNDGIGESKNAELKVVYNGTTPHVVLLACRNICIDEEIRFDYGVEGLPWRQKHRSPPSLLNEDSPGHSIKGCTVLLQKIDQGADTCVYEKEDGTEADVKINKTTHSDVEYQLSPRYETDRDHMSSTCAVNEMCDSNESSMSVSTDQRRQTTNISTPDVEMDVHTKRDSFHNCSQEETEYGHHKETFPTKEYGSQETLSQTTEEQQKGDGSGKKTLAVAGQSSHMMSSRVQEQNDDTGAGRRKETEKEDGEIVNNCRNASSEKTLCQITEEQQKGDVNGKKTLAEEIQSSKVMYSIVQEQDDYNGTGTREEPDKEDNCRNASSDKQASRVKAADANTNDDGVHYIIIEDQDATGSTTTEGSIELTLSNIGREEYTVQQRYVDVNPIDNEKHIDSNSHRSKETPASPSTSNSQSKKRPHRPCPYCLCFKSALTKHLVKKHGDKTEVIEALKLQKQDRDRAFLLLKRKGIMMANMNKLRSEGNKTQPFIRERKHTSENSDVIYCSKCFGFFKKSYFHRHRRDCHLNERSIYFPHAVQPEIVAIGNTQEEKFTTEILGSLYNDEVGQICKTDTVIVSYAQKKFRKLLTKRNVEKYEDKKTNIRTEMRRLGHLFKEFKQICGENNVTCVSSFEMYKPERFYILEEAIDHVTIKEDGCVKYGLRKDIGYLIKRICKFLHGKFSVEQNIGNRDQVDSFLNVLTFFWSDIFGEAESSLVYARQTQLRKPSRLPRQSDVKKLRDFMRSMIQQLTESDYDFIASSDFIRLRNLVVSRLTLFNARRGGEPCCLQTNQWTEAENNVWLGESNTDQDPVEQSLLGKYKIAYQTGKGEKLVPLLILDDCWKALRKLCDPEVREQASVHPKNTYVFPRIQYSLQHVSGWEAVKECCNLAGLDHVINATGMRHYVATIYAGLEINESERETFYSHMGHSESINKNIYQSPPARQTITRVGKFLHDIDQETLSHTSGEKQKGGGHVKKSLAVDVQSSHVIYSRIQEQDDTGTGTRQENDEEEAEMVSNCRNASSEIGRQYRTWSRQDTETVINYFSSCILSTENVETNKGSLPNIEELKKFLVDFPSILRECSKQEKIKRLRSKIFNERKITREKMRKTVRPEKQLSRKKTGT